MLRAGLGAVVLVSLTVISRDMTFICLGAFCLGQFSDQLDGWIARRHSIPSVPGYMQDSISDKLFHVGCLLGLGVHFPLVNLLLWGVLVREFVLLGVRVIMPDVGGSLSRLKPYSIAYAVPLRLGILALLVVPLFARPAAVAIAAIGHGLLLVAIAAAAAGGVALFRSFRIGAGRPTGSEALGPR